MWPCTVATDIGRSFKMLVVSPGHVLKWFIFMDFSNIERIGEKHTTCRYCVRSMRDFCVWMTTVREGFLYVYLSFVLFCILLVLLMEGAV